MIDRSLTDWLLTLCNFGDCLKTEKQEVGPVKITVKDTMIVYATLLSSWMIGSCTVCTNTTGTPGSCITAPNDKEAFFFSLLCDCEAMTYGNEKREREEGKR